MSFISLLFLTTLFFPMETNNKGTEMEFYDVTDVIATTYTPSEKETDSTPLITASGFKINPKNPKKHRIIAVSRDLKKRYPFGSKVKIKGLGKKYDGVYKVEDVMHSRWRKKIDILINKKDRLFKKRKVVITPIKK